MSTQRGLLAFFSVLFATFILVLTLTQLVQAIPLGSNTILIDAVLYDGSINDNEEAVRLRNISSQTVSLANWSFYDGSRQTTLPPTLTITAGQTIWIAKNEAAFTTQFGFSPDHEEPSWLGLTNTGDELFLRNENDVVIDALIYENGNIASAGSNWQGTAVSPYKELSSGVDGQILYRKLDPITGLPVPDTNTAADWAQDATDLYHGRRVLYPGWDLETFYLPTQITETAVLTIAIAPDNGYETLIHHINQAQREILIETHTFENIHIGQALVAASQRGVTVTVLLEGGPPGGISDEQKYICQTLLESGGECWSMINDDDVAAQHRYYFIHAKFMLIDGRLAMVSSENFSPNSLPVDNKSDGTFGRRGVLLFTDARQVIDHLFTIWHADFDTANHNDIAQAQGTDLLLPPDYSPPIASNPTTYTVRYPSPFVISSTIGFEIVQSPENSLHTESNILGLLNRIGENDTLLVQQLYERPYWGDNQPNLRLSAYISAAHRGAHVRIMLDQYFDSSSSATSNQATCDTLNTLARSQKLDLQCQLGNPTGLGIHNKMILAEINGRGYLHVGSINGSEQSHKGNREVALQIQNDKAYDYLADMFVHDWVYLIHFPLVLQSYTSPVSYPLISELLYDPAGLDHSEFIEIANPKRTAIDISHYSVSDAENAEQFADLRRFPPNTQIPPQSAIVIAQQATPFYDTYGFWPNFEILDTSPLVPNLVDDPNWGDQATFLQLGNSGDIIFLRDPADQTVDLIVYGAKTYPNHATCPLVDTGHSLRRAPYWRDTNDCLIDFAPWPLPDPQILP